MIGFRGEFLTSTKGTGIINTMFDGYAPYKGDFQYRKQSTTLLSCEQAISNSLTSLKCDQRSLFSVL